MGRLDGLPRALGAKVRDAYYRCARSGVGYNRFRLACPGAVGIRQRSRIKFGGSMCVVTSGPAIIPVSKQNYKRCQIAPTVSKITQTVYK